MYRSNDIKTQTTMVNRPAGAKATDDPSTAAGDSGTYDADWAQIALARRPRTGL